MGRKERKIKKNNKGGGRKEKREKGIHLA